MTMLVLAMLWSRRGRAVTVLLLAALATASAVAAPLYLAQADARIVRAEVTAAPAGERDVTVTGVVEPDAGGHMSKTFEELAAGWLDAPGYTSVFTAQFSAQPADLDRATAAQLHTVAYRDELCAHVRVVAGRCLMGAGETVATAGTAERAGVRPGAGYALSGSAFDQLTDRYVPGPPTDVTVVGVVEATDSSDPYWGRGGGDRDAWYVDRRTLDTFVRPSELQTFDAYPQPGAISVASIPALRTWLTAAQSHGTSTAKLSTGLDALLDRIDADRAQVRLTVPYATVPVLLLAWAVIVLAVAAVVRARRFEHGIVALRGVARPGRWCLATGETLVCVVAGAAAGYTAAGGWHTPGAWPYAAVAVAGALAAAVVVALRAVSAPAQSMLRHVERPAPRWRGLVVEGLLLAGAAVTVVQVRNRPGGVALLAPALVMLAVALIAGRALPALAGWAARRALHRTGRALPWALAWLRVARRPAAGRLVILVTVALASLGFAAAATAAADRGEQQQAELDTGAPVVLTVDVAGRGQLLRAVRAADPGQRYAMAVVPIPATAAGAPAALAVDSARLPAVALWRPEYAGIPVSALPALLHPPTDRQPAVHTGARLTLELDTAGLDRPDVALDATVVPDDGTTASTVDFGNLVAGRHTYSTATPGCVRGCRLTQVGVRLPPYVGATLTVTMYRPPARHWRVAPGAAATPGPDGVTFTLPASSRADAGLLRPADGPPQLPVVSTGPLPADGAFRGFGGTATPAALAAAAVRLPRVGAAGSLVDLEYADLLSADDGRADDAEVWLAADAPPAVYDALRAAGLTVTDRRTVAAARAALAAGGTALGLRFYLVAGVVSVLLGAAGLVVGGPLLDHARAGGDLRALRVQGLPRCSAAAVEPVEVLTLTGAGLLAGLVAAAAAWAAVAGTFPGLAGAGVPPLAWPFAASAGAAVFLTAVGLAGHAAGAATRTRQQRASPA